MKTLVKNYTFNASSKQIVFTDLTSIKLEQILLITNVTNNTIIYNFADATLGGIVSGNVLTLDYNTILMNNTDSLQIFIDNTETQASDVTLKDLYFQLSLLLDRLDYGLLTDSAKKLKIVAEQSTPASLQTTATIASGTVTTVTAVTDLTYLDYYGHSSAIRMPAIRIPEANLDAAFQLGFINNINF